MSNVCKAIQMIVHGMFGSEGLLERNDGSWLVIEGLPILGIVKGQKYLRHWRS